MEGIWKRGISKRVHVEGVKYSSMWSLGDDLDVDRFLKGPLFMDFPKDYTKFSVGADKFDSLGDSLQ